MEANKFESLKIIYGKKEFKFQEYEKYILNILNKINSNDKKKNFLISNEKNLTSILIFIYYLFNEYIKNVCNKNNSILNDIKKGDKLVLLNKDIMEFDSLQIFNGKEYIVGIDKKSCKRMIPIERIYELSKYSGTANRINEDKSKKIKGNIAKEFIADLINVGRDTLIGDIIDSTIFVVESKEKLYSMIYDLAVEYNGVKYSISEMFPLAYYSSEDRFEFFKGNSIKQSAVIKFTINSSVALDIIREDENVKNIIFVGEGSYRNSLESEIRQMEMYDNIDKILLMDTWESNFDFTFIDDEFGMYAITKGVLIDNMKLFSSEYETDVQQINYNMIYNTVNREMNIYEINYIDRINRNIYDITTSLKALCDFGYENIEVLDFIKIGYSLCNRLERTILPLNKCENNSRIVRKCLDNMKRYISIFDKTRIEYNIMYDILIKFNELIDELNDRNPKLEFLKKNFNNKKRYIIGIKNKDELKDVCSYFAKYPSCKFTPIVINKRNKFVNEDNVIITSYINSDEINIILTNSMLKVEVIVYKREKNKINNLIRKTENMISYIENNNLISNIDDEALTDYFKINKIYSRSNIVNNIQYNAEELENEEANIHKIIEEKFMNICIRKTEARIGEQGNRINVRKFITFEDGNYAFLTNYYKASVLKNNDIISEKINMLNINDSIVFTKNKINGEEDIVKIIIRRLLENEKFRDSYFHYFALNKLWKTELRNYMNKYCLSEANISNEFAVLGKKKHKVTISNWLNGNIIGPSDADDIRIIAKIVNSAKLNENLEKVIEACSYERRIQIEVRKALAEVIINSVAFSDREDSEFKDLIRSVVDDIDKYAYVGNIVSIKDIDEEMNQQYVNRIIEREE